MPLVGWWISVWNALRLLWLSDRATVARRKGRHERAIPLLRRAVLLAEVPPLHAWLPASLATGLRCDLAESLMRLDCGEEALAMLRPARFLDDTTAPTNLEQVIRGHLLAAMAYLDEGFVEEAERAHDTALRLQSRFDWEPIGCPLSTVMVTARLRYHQQEFDTAEALCRDLLTEHARFRWDRWLPGQESELFRRHDLVALLAAICRETGRLHEAAEWLQQAE